jgi:hypothetical protein
LVFTTDGKSVYKLDGANSDNTFKYSSKLDITFNVSSDGKSVTPIKSTTTSNYTTTSSASTKNVQSQLSALAQSHEESSDYTLGSAYSIELANSAITSNADVSITNSSVTITKGGTYSISGTLDNGQVIINTEESVTLILNNAHITSATSAPIYVENAQKTIIYVAPNTTNSLTDSANSDQKGTLMSKDNLSLYGSGTLTINANINDGLRSNDGLIIKDTKLIINSVDDGVRGKDYIIIDSANITVNSVGDTIKSDNEEESDKGYIYIKDGTFNLTSQSGDGITAQSDLLIEQGNFTLKTGGGSSTVLSEDISAKGLKSAVNIVVDGGTFDLNCADDTIHANDTIVLNNGDFTLSTYDDGVHADTYVEVNGGKINILDSYEGLESATLTINNGYITLNASDDGLNVAGGNDGGVTFMELDERRGGGRPTQDNFNGSAGEYYLNINGGYIYANAGGDGLDANGYITMNGGDVFVDGPTNNGNGAIDYDGSFALNGGNLIAVGSSGMAEAPSNTSTQNAFLIKFQNSYSANSTISIKNASGGELINYSPAKYYSSIVYSSSDLSIGNSYGVYIDGVLVKEVTLSQTITSLQN